MIAKTVAETANVSFGGRAHAEVSAVAVMGSFLGPTCRFGRGRAALKGFQEDLRIGGKSVMPELDRLAVRERFQIVREFGEVRHRGAVDQNRDDEHFVLKGRRYFDAHEIVRIVEAPMPFCIFRVQPVAADDGQQHVARPHRNVDLGDEVETRRDRVHVHEQVIGGELLRQPVVEPARRARTVLAPVIDKNSR